MRIEVLKIKALEKGNLKAFVSIKINGWLTIHDCRVVQQPDQAAWVSMPQKEYLGQDGQKKYAPVIELEKGSEQAREIESAILTAWETAPAPVQDTRNTPWRR